MESCKKFSRAIGGRHARRRSLVGAHRSQTHYSRLERWHDACCYWASMNALLAPQSSASSPPSSPAFPSAPYVRGGVLAAVRRLRYEVYCLERRFVDAATLRGRAGERRVRSRTRCTSRRPRPSGSVVATLRLVLDSPLGFPLEGTRTDCSTAAGDGARAHRGDLAPHRGAGLSRRHHPPAAAAVRPVPAPVRGVPPAGPRLPGGRHGGRPRAPAPAPRLHFLPLGASISYFGEVVPYGATWHRCGRGTRTSSTTSGPA